VAESASPTYPPPAASVASPPVVQPATSATADRPLIRLIAVLGAIAIAIGSFTPWASVSASFMSVDVNGTEGDGVITLVGGIVILGLVFSRKHLAGIIVGIITGGILLSDLGSVADLVNDDDFATVSVGWGLYLATAGAVVAVVALILLKLGERTRGKVG